MGDSWRSLLRFGSASVLGDEDALVSPSGLHELRVSGGRAALVVVASGEVLWHPGGDEPVSGDLCFAADGGLEVLSEGRRVWRSPWGCPQAMYLVITDAGDGELLDEHLVPLRSLRDGELDVRPLRAPAKPAAVSRNRFLLRQDGAVRRMVTRLFDGSLQVTERQPGGGWSEVVPAEDAVRLQRPGAVLDWVVGHRADHLTVVPGLVDLAGRVIWSLTDGWAGDERNAACATGGDVLAHGSRLRHQSLTSRSRRHTLVHQPDGNLVLYDNVRQHARWESSTAGHPGSWVELGGARGLQVRHSHVAFSTGHGEPGPQFLRVQDDGDLTVLDGHGAVLWSAGTADSSSCDDGCAPLRPGRGARLGPGEHVQRQSLTSQDGSTVLAHTDDGGVVLFGSAGRTLWQLDFRVPGGHLALTDAGMLVLRSADRTVEHRLAGPGAELLVRRGQLQLRDAHGQVLWRDGDPTLDSPTVTAADDPADTSWFDAFGLDTYRLTVVQGLAPEDVLLRLGFTADELAAPERADSRDYQGAAVLAFAVADCTLLVDTESSSDPDGAVLSADTLVVTCSAAEGYSDFLVYRDGREVADLSWSRADERWADVPALSEALAAMGSTEPDVTAAEHPVELLCRTIRLAPRREDVARPTLEIRGGVPCRSAEPGSTDQ